MNKVQMQVFVNNQNIKNAYFNLYERWLDESEYEDINEYAKVLTNVIRKNGFPITGEKATKRPFGLKFTLDGHEWKTYVKARKASEGVYMSLCAQPIWK